MDDSAKDFLEKYISKIKKYAESHNISDDLVDDISQSIYIETLTISNRLVEIETI